MTDRSPVTTHILDLGGGRPAAGVRVALEQVLENGAKLIADAATDDDGRLMSWFRGPIERGHYRLRFATGAWYHARNLNTFYPEVTLDFHVVDPDAHYHVPLLMNQWGYSTYRGS
ncbi:hydroxyisourate hydrolase [Hydrocarboniclastica marina]|uniref:5-hydroxyisourate hydrolase n=1 Tax=Hydrocarboniclastica marina TaxID=2259620 RepID=A0A4P7XLN2_9ALTE|nr:hydroxyisourate hydrolase [Hydrocarboniclastica marina]MAM00158.1 hydroxyisourate hydrolase [Alteromonadaceae bacterium]QCF27464.1 hydroxyisourate hydrolase [Hydrocarboniclastica marina]|tara:strand:+ start:311 stop:655 length:345 start_codon:yes stop_codon:yes gene_type:complete